jgi:uncharacterized protein (DUF2267 family)
MKTFQKLDKHAIYLNELVVQVATEMGRPDDHKYALTSIEAVLIAVRNRLTFEQSVNFLDLLPLPFKAVYIKDWNVQDHVPERINSMDDFINEVCKVAPDLCENDYQDQQKIKEAIRAVFKVVGLHVSQRDLEKELSYLPQDLKLYLEAEGVSLKSNAMLTSIWLS